MKTLFIPVYLKVWLRSCLTCRWSTLDRDPTTARYQLIPLSCSPSAKLFQRTLKLCSWDMIFTSVSPSSSRRRLFSSTQTASTFPIRLLWTCISNKVAACGQTVNRMVEKHHLKLLIWSASKKHPILSYFLSFLVRTVGSRIVVVLAQETLQFHFISVSLGSWPATSARLGSVWGRAVGARALGPSCPASPWRVGGNRRTSESLTNSCWTLFDLKFQK